MCFFAVAFFRPFKQICLPQVNGVAQILLKRGSHLHLLPRVRTGSLLMGKIELCISKAFDVYDDVTGQDTCIELHWPFDLVGDV